MAYTAGTAYLQVNPSFKGLHQAIRRELESYKDTLLVQVKADVDEASFRNLPTVPDTSAKVKADTAEAAREIGAFATDMQRRITAAIRALPDIELHADSSDADREIAQLRADLQSLSDKRIGIDIDAADARAELDRIRSELARLGSGSTDVQVRADTTAAVAELDNVDRKLDRIDGRTATARVRTDVDDRGIVDATNAVSMFLRNLATPAAFVAAIGAIPDAMAFVAAASQAAGAALLLPAALVGGVAAAGTFTLGISGISDALKAMSAADTASATTSTASSATRVAAARRAQAATQAVAQAELTAARSAITSGQQVADAVRAVDQARRAAADSAVSAERRVQDAERSAASARRDAAEAAVAAARRVQDAEQAASRAREDAADAAVASARRVADADREAARAREDAARAAEQSARRVTDAESQLTRAQQDARRAQEDLTQARLDAAEANQQLDFSIRGTALAERQAVIDLSKAREKLAAARNAGIGGRDLEELIIDAEQAQLRVDELRDRYGDLQTEAAEYARTGIEGSEQVQNAQQRIIDAQDGVAQAERAVSDARQAQALQARDSAESIAAADRQLADARAAQAKQARDSSESIAAADRQVADARQAQAKQARDSAESVAAADRQVADARAAQAKQAQDSAAAIQRAQESLARAQQQAAWSQQDAAQRVTDAQRALADATSGAGDAAAGATAQQQKLAAALGGLSPNARALVQTLWALKPAWDALRLDVQDRMLAGVSARVDTLAGIYLPKLHTLLGGIAGSFNLAGLSVADFFAQDATARDMDAAFANINVSAAALATTAQPLASIFEDLFVVGAEFLPDLSRGFADGTRQVAEFVDKARETGQLRQWIQQGIDTLKTLIGIVYDVGRSVFEVFSAANRNGAGFLDTVHQVTTAVREFLTSAQGQNYLDQVFQSISATVDRLKPGVSAVLGVIRDVIAHIAPMLPGVADSFSRIAEKLAPIMTEILIRAFDVMAFLFDIISRTPEPVLIAAAGLFIAVAGVVTAANAVKSVTDMFSTIKSSAGHVGDVRDKIKDIFGALTGKGRLKDVLLGDDGCASTRSCLTDINGKIGDTDKSMDKIRKKGGLKGALLGAGAALAGIGALAVTADELLPEADPGRDAQTNPFASITDYLDQTRRDLSDFADFFRGVFTDPIGEVKLQWNDFWGELKAAPGQVWTTVSTDAVNGWQGLKRTLAEEGGEWRDGWNTFWTGATTTLSQEASEWGLDVKTGWAGLTTTLAEEGAVWRDGWNSFWTGVGDELNREWTSFRTGVSTHWQGLKADAAANWATFKTDWTTFWGDVGTTLSTRWEEFKATASVKWSDLKTDADAKWQTFRADWNTFWSDVWTNLSQKWEEIKTTARTKWDEHKADADAKWAQYRLDWSNMWSIVTTYFAQKMEEFKATARGAWDWVRVNVWEPMINFVTVTLPNGFSSGVDAIGRLWDRIRAALRTPLQAAIDIVWNNGIVAVWDNVRSIVPGLPDIPGRNFQLRPLAAGGPVERPTAALIGEAGPEYVISAPAVRNLGGMAAVDALHTSALSPRATIRALNAGTMVEGAEHTGPGISTVGYGGVRPHVAQAGHFLGPKFGIGTIGGVGARANASDHPGGLALDFMTRGENGTALADYLSSAANWNHYAIKYIIWRQRIRQRPGNGWSPMADRGSPTANHMDHVHVSFTGTPGQGASDGGVGGPSLLDLLTGAWGRVRDAVARLGSLGGSPWGDAVAGFGRKIVDSVWNMVSSKAAELAAAAVNVASGAASIGGGGPVRDVVQRVAAQFGMGAGAEWAALQSIIQRESGWNPTAQNPRSTAYGLFQFLNGTWATVGATKTSDPAQQTLAGIAYIRQRYGSAQGAAAYWNAHGSYDGGGMLNGSGIFAKQVLTPERVLSTRQNAAFEQLVAGLTRRGTVDRYGRGFAEGFGGGRGEGGTLIGNLTIPVPEGSTIDDTLDAVFTRSRHEQRRGRYGRPA